MSDSILGGGVLASGVGTSKSKFEVPKTKGIVIGYLSRDQNPTLLAFVIGKGKGKLVELHRPLKKKSLESFLEHERPRITPELGDKMDKLNTQQ